MFNLEFVAWSGQSKTAILINDDQDCFHLRIPLALPWLTLDCDLPLERETKF